MFDTEANATLRVVQVQTGVGAWTPRMTCQRVRSPASYTVYGGTIPYYSHKIVRFFVH